MRGHIRQRGSKWYVVVELPPTPDGKRRQRWVPAGTTKRDAERELTRILRELDQGIDIDPGKLTVGEYLDRWLADYAKSHTSAQTYERYKEIVEIHLKSAMGGVLLSKLTPLHIQRHYTKAMDEPRKGRSRPLSARTVLQHHRVIREALKFAVRWRLLAVNPADAVEPPSVRRKEMGTLTPEQAGRLMETAKKHRLYVPICLSLLCALRKGEVFGLRWEDLDLGDGLLRVRRSAEYPSTGPALKEPKSGRARVVKMPELMVEILREHQKKQREWIDAQGSEYSDQGLVCALRDGRIGGHYGVNRDLDVIIGKAGVPRVRFHDLRHSHATALLAAKIAPKVVSERLGHSQISITQDLYSHVWPDMQAEAASAIDLLFGGKKPASAANGLQTGEGESPSMEGNPDVAEEPGSQM